MEKKEELIRKHKEERCRKCKIQNCNGITFTINKKTRCDKDYED